MRAWCCEEAPDEEKFVTVSTSEQTYQIGINAFGSKAWLREVRSVLTRCWNGRESDARKKLAFFALRRVPPFSGECAEKPDRQTILIGGGVQEIAFTDIASRQRPVYGHDGSRR